MSDPQPKRPFADPDAIDPATIGPGIDPAEQFNVTNDLPEASPNPQGRRVKLTEIKACGMDFMNDEETAARLGMHVNVWKALKKKYKAVAYAHRAGQALGRALIKAQSRKLMMVHGSAGTSMTIHLRRIILGETEKKELRTTGTQTVVRRHEIDLTKCSDQELAVLRTIIAREEAERGKPDQQKMIN
jgi:hypothetical protein